MHRAVERKAGCPARFFNVQTVIEHMGDSEFSRSVQTFTLDGHEKAKRAFVWRNGVISRGEPQYHVVLGEPPIYSAQDAMKSVVKDHTRKLADLD